MKVGLAVYEGCMASGLFAFAELLEASNKRSGKKYFDCVYAGINHSPVSILSRQGLSGAQITPQTTITDTDLDAILLPGFWVESASENEEQHARYKTLVEALAKMENDKLIWSYCSAVGLVARAGKLDWQQATSTWWLANFLQDNFDHVNWRFNQTCIFQGMNATASGVNGYLPIATHIIRTICGERVLRDITNIMVVPRPEKEIQPFQQINLMLQDDRLIRRIVLWVEKTPAASLSVDKLGEFLNLTTRTLSRQVKAKTGQSCAHFMRLIKLHQAGEMLIYSPKPVNVISNELGYSDDASLRRSFKKITSYTPSEYQQFFKR